MSRQRSSDSEPEAKRLTRRDFLTTAAGAAGAAATGGLAAITGGCTSDDSQTRPVATEAGVPMPAGVKRGAAGPIGKRTLGRTGMQVSVLSLGGIGADIGPFQAGLDKGINLIHCALGYGSLGRVAQAIAGRRDELFLGLKYERANAVDWDYLQRSLDTLQVDYVDILFFPLNSPQAARDRSHLQFFQQVQKRKQARFIGITTHTDVIPTLQAAIDAGFWEVLMPSYVPAERERARLRPVLEQAGKRNLGVVAMKTMAGIAPSALGHMQTVVREVLADDNVTTLCKGLLTFEHLEAFLAAASGKPTEAERASLQQYLASRQGQSCFVCGRCPTCPKGVNIFEVVRDFDYYYAQAGNPQVARAMYQLLPPNQRGSVCVDCNACAGQCPYNIDIARHVQAADLVLG